MRLVSLSTLLLAAGCVSVLPPAPAPDHVAPRLAPSAPPAEGHGRLVVDVVEGPTPVYRVSMQPHEQDDGKGRVSWYFSESTELLCAASPCALDLPVGNLTLGFPVLGQRDAMEVELVHVGAEPTVYRRSLTLRERHGAGTVLGILGTVFGGMSAVTGIVFLPLGLAKDNDGFTTAGAITLGAGAALLALGIWAITLDPATYRQGSSSHFALPAE